jgi:hypothetical protein
MIKDFVRDHVAWLSCSECGAETTILKYHFDGVYNFPTIDHEQTESNLHAFVMKHSLCKATTEQLTMFNPEPISPEKK